MKIGGPPLLRPGRHDRASTQSRSKNWRPNRVRVFRRPGRGALPKTLKVLPETATAATENDMRVCLTGPGHRSEGQGRGRCILASPAPYAPADYETSHHSGSAKRTKKIPASNEEAIAIWHIAVKGLRSRQGRARVSRMPSRKLALASIPRLFRNRRRPLLPAESFGNL